MTKCEITERDAKFMQKRLFLNLGQNELIFEKNELNESWIDNDDIYINSDCFIDGLIKGPWFQGLSNTPGAMDYGHENLESVCSDEIICGRIYHFTQL
jgi:hypothetical protein